MTPRLVVLPVAQISGARYFFVFGAVPEVFHVRDRFGPTGCGLSQQAKRGDTSW
jgi:hypothetical protein